MSNTTPDSAGIGFLAAYLRQVYACSGAALWGGRRGGGQGVCVCLSGYEEAPQITSDCPGEARKDKTETPLHPDWRRSLVRSIRKAEFRAASHLS